jgi:hypothetical protein
MHGTLQLAGARPAYRLYCGHNGNKSAGLGNLKRNTIIVCMSERRNAVINKSVLDMKEEFHERKTDQREKSNRVSLVVEHYP